jgi:hypothetical protein
MVAVCCVATVSAQSKIESAVNTIANQKWSVGLRVGSGIEVDAECFYADKAYIEGRLGLNLFDNFFDFMALHNWNCCNWNWTPEAGKWFLDAGVGARVGGNKNCCVLGVAGQAKFGIKFNKVPIRLAIDITPTLGPVINYAQNVTTTVTDAEGTTTTTTTKIKSSSGFYSGVFNFGLSATWCF